MVLIPENGCSCDSELMITLLEVKELAWPEHARLLRAASLLLE